MNTSKYEHNKLKNINYKFKSINLNYFFKIIRKKNKDYSNF